MHFFIKPSTSLSSKKRRVETTSRAEFDSAMIKLGDWLDKVESDLVVVNEHGKCPFDELSIDEQLVFYQA